MIVVTMIVKAGRKYMTVCSNLSAPERVDCELEHYPDPKIGAPHTDRRSGRGVRVTQLMGKMRTVRRLDHLARAHGQSPHRLCLFDILFVANSNPELSASASLARFLYLRMAA